MSKFIERKHWRLEDLANRLFEKGGISRVSMWKGGNSNPRYEQVAKLIELGATAQELFGEDLGTKLVQNSLSQSSEFQEGLQLTQKPMTRDEVIALFKSMKEKGEI